MLNPAFNVKLGQQILSGLVVTGKFDGKYASVCLSMPNGISWFFTSIISMIFMCRSNAKSSLCHNRRKNYPTFTARCGISTTIRNCLWTGHENKLFLLQHSYFALYICIPDKFFEVSKSQS